MEVGCFLSKHQSSNGKYLKYNINLQIFINGKYMLLCEISILDASNVRFHGLKARLVGNIYKHNAGFTSSRQNSNFLSVSRQISDKIETFQRQK